MKYQIHPQQKIRKKGYFLFFLKLSISSFLSFNELWTHFVTNKLPTLNTEIIKTYTALNTSESSTPNIILVFINIQNY